MPEQEIVTESTPETSSETSFDAKKVAIIVAASLTAVVTVVSIVKKRKQFVSNVKTLWVKENGTEETAPTETTE